MTGKSYTEVVHSKKFIIILVTAVLALLLLCWFVFRARENRITEFDPSGYTTVTEGYRYALDEVSCKNDQNSLTKDEVTIDGWIIRPGEAVAMVTIRVVLKDKETGKYYLLPTSVDTRDDVTLKMNDGNNYDYCGFSTSVPYWEALDTDKDYGIYVLYELNGKKPVLVDLSATLKTWEKKTA